MSMSMFLPMLMDDVDGDVGFDVGVCVGACGGAWGGGGGAGAGAGVYEYAYAAYMPAQITMHATTVRKMCIRCRVCVWSVSVMFYTRYRILFREIRPCG